MTTNVLRVLHVISSLATGGAERSLVELVPALTRYEVEASITCLYHREPSFRVEAERAGIQVRVLEASSMPSRVRELRGLLKRARPDVLHTTLFEADIAGRLAAIGTGIPVITSLVNTSYDETRRRDPAINVRKLRVVQGIDGWTARHLTDGFHAITESVKSSCVASLRLDPSRVMVVERGRDPRRLGIASPERRLQVRQALGLTGNDEVVLNIGRQEYQKGHDDLLRATAHLAQNRPDLVLLLAGREGHASSDLRALVSTLGIADHVRFLGFREDVGDLLAASDVFAFPSLYEGLGGAVLEAMALSVPIVATRIGPLEEVLDEGQNALLVGVHDPIGLAEAIAVFLSDPERRRAFGERGRKSFEDRFTLDRSAARMAELYARVLADHGRV